MFSVFLVLSTARILILSYSPWLTIYTTVALCIFTLDVSSGQLAVTHYKLATQLCLGHPLWVFMGPPYNFQVGKRIEEEFPVMGLLGESIYERERAGVEKAPT